MHAALAVALGTLALAPAAADEVPPVAAITVTGEASAEVVPDIAHVAVGIDSERPTAAAATAEVAAAAQAATATLKAEGVADADVTTAALELEPIYPDNGPAASRPPRSFRAFTMFRITIRPAERAGAIASRLIEKGANTIRGVDYASSREKERLDELRAEAMRDARHKAEVYTGALGLGLGRVIEITPVGGGVQPMGATLRNASILAAPKASMPSAPGTLTLSAAVTVRWALTP